MKKFILLCAAIFSVGTLASCGSESDNAVSLTVTEPVVRSIDSASYKNESTGKYMTGAFMTISNSSDADITLEGGSSSVAGIVEIHEVINGEMTAMPNGLVIPANGSVKLRMGGYHVMLLELDHELKPGEEVTFTLRFSDGTSQEITAPVKDIAMDDEVYGVSGGM